jgi:hypothetical protein
MIRSTFWLVERVQRVLYLIPNSIKVNILKPFGDIFFSAPEWFEESWMSKIKTGAGNNWRLKVRWNTFWCKPDIGNAAA